MRENRLPSRGALRTRSSPPRRAASSLERDREAETRAPELSVRRPIRLAEGLEDHFLLLGRDPDPGILHRDLQGAVLPASDQDLRRPLLGEFDGVGEEVGEDLPQALWVGRENLRYALFDLQRKRQALHLGLVVEALENPLEKGEQLHLRRLVPKQILGGEKGLLLLLEGEGMPLEAVVGCFELRSLFFELAL